MEKWVDIIRTVILLLSLTEKITGMFLINHLTLIWHLFVPIKEIITQDKVYGRKTSRV